MHAGGIPCSFLEPFVNRAAESLGRGIEKYGVVVSHAIWFLVVSGGSG